MRGQKSSYKTPFQTGRKPLPSQPSIPNLLFLSRQLLRDFAILLDFDLNVLYYSRRPVPIPYTDREGCQRIYTPSFLVTYRTDIIPAKWMLPLLCEVISRDDLLRNWRELKPMLRAARQHARESKWRFQIITEREVRTPYLNNAKFLLPYSRQETDWEQANLLMDTLYELRLASPEALLAACASAGAERARLMPSLWEMLAKKRVGVDLTLPLTMQSPIWSHDV